jgi:hypothetical protein
VSWRAAWLGVRRHDIPGPAEHLAGRALTQIGVTQRPQTRGTRDFQDHGRSPHESPRGLYRTPILATGERVTCPRKCAFTREYGHAVSLLIMTCFESVGRRFDSYRGGKLAASVGNRGGFHAMREQLKTWF